MRHMGEMGCLGGEIKDSAPKMELHSEIWGKGACDIWEKWVVWVEKSNTSAAPLRFLFPLIFGSLATDALAALAAAAGAGGGGGGYVALVYRGPLARGSGVKSSGIVPN